MKSRITQLIARYVGMALLALAASMGVEGVEGEVRNVAQELGIAVVGVLALIADMVIHKIATGGFMTSAGEKTDRKRRSDEDKKTGGHVPLALLVLMVPAFVGCASNPVDRYLEVQRTVNTARNTIGAAHDARLITDRELLTLDSYEKSIRDTLADVRNRLPRDEEGNLDPEGEMDEQSIESMLEVAERWLGRLMARYEEMANEPPRDSDDSAGDEGGGAGDAGVLRLDRRRDRVVAEQRAHDARTATRDRGGNPRVAA